MGTRPPGLAPGQLLEAVPGGDRRLGTAAHTQARTAIEVSEQCAGSEQVNLPEVRIRTLLFDSVM